MSGLDRIVEEIRKQAESESGDILKKAEAYSDTYMANAKERVSEEVDAYHQKAKAERELYEAKVKSGMSFKERNAILQTKQQCIETCLARAVDKMKGLPAAEYFALLETLLQANVQKAAGVMQLSAQDLERVPEDFAAHVKAIAQKNGGTLEIAKEPAQIENGFLLIYGEIEENCTFQALFAEGKDRLKDIAAKELFGNAQS